jgi:hypothetical protein
MTITPVIYQRGHIVENWKWVVGYEGLYEVSDQGKIRSVDRSLRAKAGGFSFRKGVVLKHRIRHGYKQYGLYKEGKQKFFNGSVLVGSAFIGPREKNWVYDHINEDRQDDRLCNLQLITQRENTLRSMKKRGSKVSEYPYVYFDKSKNRWRWSKSIGGRRTKKSKGFLQEKEAYEDYLKHFPLHLS